MSTSYERLGDWLPPIDWNVKLYGAHRRTVPAGWFMQEEAHVGFEMLLLINGAQETVIGSNRYLLQSGDIILIPPGFKHTNRCAATEGMTYFCLHFHVNDPLFCIEMIQHNRFLYPAGSADNTQFAQVLEHLMQMLQPGRTYTTSDRFLIQSHLFGLLSLLSQLTDSPDAHRESSAPTSVHYARMIAETLKHQFDLDPARDTSAPALGIEQIIRSLGITPGYGLEVFRKVYGMSPRRFLSELKLNEAKTLIRQPELALSEIAQRLGYAHLSHFSRQFKRWTGMSPLEYRRSASPGI